jgi:hypothetical protein
MVGVYTRIATAELTRYGWLTAKLPQLLARSCILLDFGPLCCHSLPGVRLRFIYGWVQRDQAGSRARFWMTPSVVWEARSAPAWSRQSICSQEGRFVIPLYKLLHTLQRDCSIDGDLWSDFGINRQQIVEKLFWPLAIYLLFTGAR